MKAPCTDASFPSIQSERPSQVFQSIRSYLPRRIHGSILLASFLLLSNPVAGSEGVILLHGLCRRASSMEKMETSLKAHGYTVANIDYPSRTASISDLSLNAISNALDDPRLKDCSKIHFVTHSLGGILARYYFSIKDDKCLGRVVMLGPPNQGSEIVDKIGSWWLFKKLNGPAGNELGTGKNSTPNKLGPVNFELGVIAGDRSINWINSLTMICGSDDGKVSVERTKVQGMKEHITLHTTHTFMMKNKEVIHHTLKFLKTGSFSD